MTLFELTAVVMCLGTNVPTADSVERGLCVAFEDTRGPYDSVEACEARSAEFIADLVTVTPNIWGPPVVMLGVNIGGGDCEAQGEAV